MHVRMQLRTMCPLMRMQVGIAPHACWRDTGLLCLPRMWNRYARGDRIGMWPLPTPANVATWKHFCNIRLK
jgi:hypothetical protein